MSDTGWRPLQKPARAAARATGIGSTPFSKLAVAHLLSLGGDALVTLALAGSLFFNISPTEARGKVALSLLLTIAPFAVVAPLLGPAIDRVQGGRRFVVVATMLGRTAACIAMARNVHSLFLFPAAFAQLVLSKGYVVTKAALVPAVVTSDEELVQANAKLTVGGAIVGLVAAIPGVAILKLFNASAVLYVAALVFVVGAVAAAQIRPAREDRKAPVEEREFHVRSRGIMLAAAVMAVLRGAVGFLTFLLAFNFRRSGASAIWFGVVLVASVAGGLVGAAVAPRLRTAVREENIVVGSLFLLVVGGATGAYLGGKFSATLLAAVVGLAAGTGKLAFDSLVQRDAHEAARGRSFARFEAGFQLTWVVGALIPVVITIPERPGFAILAISALAAGVVYVVARLRPPGSPEQHVRPDEAVAPISTTDAAVPAALPAPVSPPASLPPPA